MTLLQALDQKLIWHPFSQEALEPPNVIMTHGLGAYVYDESGKAYLDLVSSWWVNLHGHAHPDIAASIAQQAEKLEHIMFAGFSHEPAILLCEQLAKQLPIHLKKFFFQITVPQPLKLPLKWLINTGIF